ncbi:MAG: hypothetical protein AAFV88_03385 [Planctomycetota bacterium]
MDSARCIQIRTGSRLHFGLLRTGPPFGGLGMMIHDPATILQFSRSETLIVDPAIASRANPILARLREHRASQKPLGLEIRLLRTSLSHCGFGSGTQLSLAIAEGAATLLGIRLSKETLALEVAGRGKRSAIGVHGYFHGGLLFETPTGSHSEDTPPSPADTEALPSLNLLEERCTLPADWRVALVLPRPLPSRMSGDREAKQFEQLSETPAHRVDLLSRLVREDVLPAVETADFDRFSHAISAYNHASGMLYESVQGGPYNGEAVSGLVQRLRGLGAVGVGQTSWGPCVFAWCPTAQDAEFLRRKLHGAPVQVIVTTPLDRGRTLTDV